MIIYNVKNILIVFFYVLKSIRNFANNKLIDPAMTYPNNKAYKIDIEELACSAKVMGQRQ